MITQTSKQSAKYEMWKLYDRFDNLPVGTTGWYEHMKVVVTWNGKLWEGEKGDTYTGLLGGGVLITSLS